MHRGRDRAIAIALALVLAAVGLAVTGTGATAEPAQPESPRPQRITLITGDRVEVVRGVAELIPGQGREGIGFAETRSADGRYTVIPADALPLVGSGRLDPRLFDVAQLLKAGYGDADRGDLPLIVTYAGAQARQRIAGAGARIVRDLTSIGGGAVIASKAEATTFWNGLKADRVGIDQVWLDGPVRASLDQSVPQIGAPTAWAAGLTGKGVKVAVLDTGIDATHPDLDDAVLEAKDFSDSGSPTDYFGHGTHVSSIITGSGEASDGRYQGVAPDVRLLIGKVLDDGGSGTDSSIIAGMEWAAAEGARIVNLSLGGCATDGTDPLSRSVNTLTARHGTLFVVAAGNHPANPSCFHDERVSTPAAADQALAVASVTKQDELSPFSNVGPRIGDHALKPEISAPGQAIVAAKAAESGGDPDERYVSASGTSMAAPHVAGAAALLAQQHPTWKSAQLRAALMASAKPNPSLGVFQQGAGRVDLTTAIEQSVLPEPAGLSFGLAEWPHADDKPISKRLTYRNTGKSARTLDLAITGDAPAGLFAISARKVTVPAGGTVGVTVTTDTRVRSADGLFSGWVTASAAGKPVARTPLGVNKEVESYDLTISAIDAAGQPAASQAYLTRPSDDEVREAALAGEPLTLRLPAGTYDLTVPVYTDNPEPDLDHFAMIARPEVKLTRDTEVVVDARTGRKVRARVDSATAEPVGQSAIRIDNGSLTLRMRGGDDGNLSSELYAAPTRRVRSYPYTFGFNGSLAEPESTSERPPRGYFLDHTIDGRIPEPTLRIRDAELARVRTRLHGEGVGENRPGELKVVIADDSYPVPLGFPVNIPSERIDFYSARPGLEWASEVTTDQTYEYDYDGTAGFAYRPGRQYEKHWGRAALGPAMRPSFAYERLWVNIGAASSSSARHHTGLVAPDGVVARNTLRRNGVVIGTNDEPEGGTFEDIDPKEAATYRFSTRTTRAADWTTLATRVDATWTFKGPFEEFVRPSSLAVRVAGDFDLLNRAPAGQPFPLTVAAENVNGTQPQLKRIELSASFDDGKTWLPLSLERDGDGYRTTVPKPPANARFVSLRSAATATDGAAVEQTVIRSYALAR